MSRTIERATKLHSSRHQYGPSVGRPNISAVPCVGTAIQQRRKPENPHKPIQWLAWCNAFSLGEESASLVTFRRTKWNNLTRHCLLCCKRCNLINLLPCNRTHKENHHGYHHQASIDPKDCSSLQPRGAHVVFRPVFAYRPF